MKFLAVLIMPAFLMACTSMESDESAKSSLICEQDIYNRKQCWDTSKVSVDELLVQSTSRNCPALLQTLIKTRPPEELFNATDSFMTRESEQFTADAQELRTLHEGDVAGEAASIQFQSRANTVQSFGAFLNEKCLPNQDSSQACLAKKIYNDKMAQIKQSIGKLLAEEDAEIKANAEREPQKVFKTKYCSEPNLFSVLYIKPQQVEEKCLYLLHGYLGKLYVIQSADGGILVGQPNPGQFFDKTIFIQTKRKYADGDIIPEQFVRSRGLKSYTSAVGVERTVNAFEFLGNAEYADDSREPLGVWNINHTPLVPSEFVKAKRSSASSGRSN